MNQSESIMKLAEALAKAQSDMAHAHKGADNPFFKSKYADLPAVIDAARPHLTANGLSVVQVTDFDESGMWIITQLSHASGEWIRGRYKIKPIKEDPQGVGSAITYARRYAYQAMVGIATSLDDDDGNAASNVEKDNKSVFKNAALRKAYMDNVIQAIDAAESSDLLNDAIALYQPKFKEMRSSGNEYDELAVDEMGKRYKLKLAALKKSEQEAESLAASYPKEFIDGGK